MTAGTQMMDCGEALNAAFKEEMRRDEKVVMWGEDIITMGSPTAGNDVTTAGLVEEFGPLRVRDTPVVESAIVGMAVGAAMTGLRPIGFIMTGGFQLAAFDPIFSRLGSTYQEFHHKGTVPAVIVGQVLGEAAKGPDHALSPEALFMHSPGLKIVMPSTVFDTKGLMKAAIRDDFPVLFYNHRMVMLGGKQEIPTEEYIIPLGKADVKREGTDVTIVTYSGITLKVLTAAAELAKNGVSAEVVDLRCLVPLDVETIVQSAKKTGAVLIVHEAMKRGGAAGEIAMRVAEEAPDVVRGLRHPIKRLAAKNVALPTRQGIENRVLPQVADIVQAAKALV